MIGGIGHQPHVTGQVHAHVTTQQTTPVSQLTGGKSKKVDKGDEDTKKTSGKESSTEVSEETSATSAQFGGTVSGFLKSKSKDKSDTVGRRYVSIDEAEEEEDVSETSSTKETSNIGKTKMETMKKPSQAGIAAVSRRTGERENELGSISDFIDDWLRLKRSPAYSFDLGEVIVEEGTDNKVDPFLLLAISAKETSYGKEGRGIKGLMGLGDGEEGPEEQISMAATKFNLLREKGEGDNNQTVNKQLFTVNCAGWTEDMDWHKLVFRYYQEIKRAWERYQEMSAR